MNHKVRKHPIRFAPKLKTNRLQWLIFMSKGDDIPKKARDIKRREFELKRNKLLILRGKNCFCCNTEAHHRHHIIPLGKGGLNRSNNLVPLCCAHHEEIHPWMRQYPKVVEPVKDARNIESKTNEPITKTLRLGKKQPRGETRRAKPLSSFSGVVFVKPTKA